MKEQLCRLLKGQYTFEYLAIKFARRLKIHPKEYKLLKNFRLKPKIIDADFIPLYTYDGSGQVTHPDVIYDGERYIMACTPYPFSDENYENPCLYASENGNDWNPCLNAVPLIDGYDENGKYNSDPDLIFYDGKYQLMYRINETEPIKRNKIMTMCSGDLSKWSKPMCILESENSEILSPAAIVEDEQLKIFYIENSGGGAAI